MTYYLGAFDYQFWGGREWKDTTIVRLIKADSVLEAELKGNQWFKDREEKRKEQEEKAGIHFEPMTLNDLEISEPIE